MRYRATLTTSDPSVSPVLHEVSAAEAGPDFKWSVSQVGQSPGTGVTIQAGQSVELALSIEPVRGFASTVEWTVEGLPDGVSLAGEPRPLTPPETRTVILHAEAGAQTGTVPVTVRARSNGLEHQATLSLYVTPAPTATPTATATATATSTPLPTPTPFATLVLSGTLPSPTTMSPGLPASPWSFWPGIGLAGAGVLLLLAWGIVRWATRSRAAEGNGEPKPRAWLRHWAWVLLSGLLLLVGLFWSWRYVAARRAEWQAYQERVPPGVRVSGAPDLQHARTRRDAARVKTRMSRPAG